MFVVCIRASGHVLNYPVSETGEGRGEGEGHSADGDSEGLRATGDTWLGLGGHSEALVKRFQPVAAVCS